MQPRTHWTKAHLIESLREHTTRSCQGDLAACCPVFEIAERFFLVWLERYPKEEFSGAEYAVMADLSAAARELPNDETTAWVSVYVGLYYCDNFPGFASPAWAWLLQHDPNNLRFAIQACQYVHWSSGRSGWATLKSLVQAYVRPETAIPILRECGQEDLLK